MAYNAEGRQSLRQDLRQMSKVLQFDQATFRRTNAHDGLLAIRLMGTKHHGPLLDGIKTTKVSGSWYRLFHEMGGSRSPSHYHGEEYLKLCMEEYHLQVRDTKSARLRQWKTIRQQRIQEFLLRARY